MLKNVKELIDKWKKATFFVLVYLSFMKIEVESVKYTVNIDQDEMNQVVLDRVKTKEALLAYDWVLKASVNDMGPFVWIELTVSPEVGSNLVLFAIKNVFQDYLIK